MSTLSYTHNRRFIKTFSLQISMVLENALMDKKVIVEIRGPPAEAQTILYWGKYKGVHSLGSHEMIMLEDCKHYNRGCVVFGDDETKKIHSLVTAIRLVDVISVDVRRDDDSD